MYMAMLLQHYPGIYVGLGESVSMPVHESLCMSVCTHTLIRVFLCPMYLSMHSSVHG